MQKKILLLGSGELGKEFVIAAQRIGQKVIAVDSYENAPAMQVAHGFEVINMLDGAELDRIVAKHQPDFIVPEIEAIRTEVLADLEAEGFHIVPSARAAQLTMNRDAIRDLAASELGLTTSTFEYATSREELAAAAARIGFPLVVKPVMSSSGKGQSTVKDAAGIDADEVIVFCACPNEASAAVVAKKLMEHGFGRVRPLAGGIDAWVAKGHDVQQGAAAQLP